MGDETKLSLTLKLSFNNIKTKKGRTILTAFASSIGIIGIALVLSLSNGFDKQIDKFEEQTLSSLPILISKEAMNITSDNMQALSNRKDENKFISVQVESRKKVKDAISSFKNKLGNLGIKTYLHYEIIGYPHDINRIIRTTVINKNKFPLLIWLIFTLGYNPAVVGW